MTTLTQRERLQSRARAAARRLGLGRTIERQWHRTAVGGMWEEIGSLQYEFLVTEGLAPHDRLLDVGCGSLRGGVHFVGYLEPGHYFGVDADASLLAAGRTELERAELESKRPVLVADDDFRLSKLGEQFDFALAQSLFTHLTLNRIAHCIAEVNGVLRPGGRFYATFFANPGPRLRTEPLQVNSDRSFDVFLDKDPFYYDPAVFAWLCEGSELAVEYRGAWGHPRDQHMLVFTKQS